jgi:hypothetical protein
MGSWLSWKVGSEGHQAVTLPILTPVICPCFSLVPVPILRCDPDSPVLPPLPTRLTQLGRRSSFSPYLAPGVGWALGSPGYPRRGED